MTFGFTWIAESLECVAFLQHRNVLRCPSQVKISAQRYGIEIFTSLPDLGSTTSYVFPLTSTL